MALAKGSLDRVAMRDPETRYNPMTIADLQAKTPNFDWKVYLDWHRPAPGRHGHRHQPALPEDSNDEIGTAALPAIKSYLRWHAVHGAASAAQQAFPGPQFRLLLQHAERPEGRAAPLEALHRRNGPRTRRGRRTGVGAARTSPPSPRRNREAGQGARSRHGRGPQVSAMDEP